MQKYKSNIITTTGLAQRNISVRVLDDNGALAALYADRYGKMPIANPQVTAVDGTFAFYAANGRYSLQTTINGVTYTDQDVVLAADPEDMLVAGPIADAVNSATASVLATATGAASAAQASQSAAASSAGNAATSEANALASRNAAASSAGAALISEGNTLANKNASDVSASAAATSASNAATSESNALASKNAAAAAAANAATYAQGYANGGVYGAGITLNDRFTFVAKDNELYRLADSVALPYTTTGDWASESSKFVSIGDRNLRQELASPSAGVALAAYMPPWTGAVARTQYERNRDFLTLSDFGVYPNSGKDESAGIQAALDAAATTGLALHVRGGEYLHTKPLVVTSYVNIIGCGAYNTRFTKTARDTLPTLPNLAAPAPMGTTDVYSDKDASFILYPLADGQYTANVRIEGVGIECVNGVSTYGIYAPRLSMSRFVDLAIGGRTTGVYLSDSWMTLWERVRAHDCAVGFNVDGQPWSANGTSGVAGGTTNCFVACWSHNISAVAWKIKGTAYASLINCGADQIIASAPNRAISYWIESCTNFSMLNCGTENVQGTPLYVKDSNLIVTGMNATTGVHSAPTIAYAPLVDVAGFSRVTLDGCSFAASGDLTGISSYVASDTSILRIRRNTEFGTNVPSGGPLGIAQVIRDEDSSTQASITFSATGGSITVQTAFNASVVRNSAGNYTITASNPISRVVPLALSSGAITNVNAVSGSSVNIITADITGTATDVSFVSVAFL